MAFKAGLTRQTLSQHFAYHAWQYGVILLASIGLWSLIYQTTAYRPPEDAKIILYIQSAAANQETVNAFLEPVWKQAVPDEEEVSAVILLPSGRNENYYSSMQLVTYMSAAAGDIYMLSQEDFKRFASQGAFVSLDKPISEGVINADGLDLSSGLVTLVTFDDQGEMVVEGQSAQFGIPAAGLDRFSEELSIQNQNLVLAVAQNSGNVEDSIVFLNALIDATREPGPKPREQGS